MEQNYWISVYMFERTTKMLHKIIYVNERKRGMLMMCYKIKNIMREFIKNEVSEELHQNMDQHIKHCKGCKDEFFKQKIYFETASQLQETKLPYTIDWSRKLKSA